MNSNSYYTPGNAKRERKKDPMWLKKIAERAFTSDEILDKIRNGLTPKEQLEFIRSFAPKEIKIEQDTQIRLIINGLQQVNSIDRTDKKVNAITENCFETDRLE